MQLNVARTLVRSSANGPGERFVVWVQGCPLACRGCWNPDTWSFAQRTVVDIDTLTREILGTPNIDGVTFTGGEPFAQVAPLAELARRVRAHAMSVVAFTGYTLDELLSFDARALLSQVDLLIAGRYDQTQRAMLPGWRSSRNQTLHFLTNRFSELDVEETAVAEVHVEADGKVVVTGFPEEGAASIAGGLRDDGRRTAGTLG
ncbi:MAG: radical SAM protein [Polyangiaceae bacterium]|nr:radical SAM protein [Polyangiaceae bacterium]